MTDTTPIFKFVRALEMPFPAYYIDGERKEEYGEILPDLYNEFETCFFQVFVETGLSGCKYIYDRILANCQVMQDYFEYPEPDDEPELISRFEDSLIFSRKAIGFIRALISSSFPEEYSHWDNPEKLDGQDLSSNVFVHYERITLDEVQTRRLYRNLVKYKMIEDADEDGFVYFFKGIGNNPPVKMTWKHRATMLLQLLEQISRQSIEFQTTTLIWSNHFKAGTLRCSYQQITDSARERNDRTIDPILEGVK